MRGRAITALAAAALLLACTAAAQNDGELPRIFLEKKVFAETKKGKKSFFEAHTVTEGENLWKILKRSADGTDALVADLLKEFLRANPAVANPDLIRPGQRVLVPMAAPARGIPPEVVEKTASYKVVKGDRLIRILASRGVARAEMSRYLAAVKEVNPSIRDVNRILAGSTIRIPTPGYFEREAAPPATAAAKEEAPAVVAQAPLPPQPSVGAEEAPAKPEAPPAAPSPPKEVGPAPPAASPPPPAAKSEPGTPPPQVIPPPAAKPGAEPAPEAPALTKSPPVPPPPEEARIARPEAQLAPPPRPAPEEGVRSVPGAKAPEESPLPAPKPPYRGLLMDVVRGLGEAWRNRGTLYIPDASGGELVLNLEDFPVVRFGTGVHVLIDFAGRLDASARRLITRTWRDYRVVSMDDFPDPAAMIGRLLSAAGYHSVKDGTAHPLVIGESLSVELPARFVVLKTENSLLSGDVILIKEVPEKPPADLAAVIAYAERVGIRVLPFAADPSAREGFLVGIDEPGPGAGSPPLTVPPDALPAVDFALEYLGLPKGEGRRLQIGGAKGSYLLTVQPDRVFEANGKTYVVDAGRMSRPILALVRESGYATLSLRRDETGISAFRRILAAAGVEPKGAREFLLAGGGEAGYTVRLTGALLASPELLELRKVRAIALVRGRVHPATRALLRELGVEIIGW